MVCAWFVRWVSFGASLKSYGSSVVPKASVCFWIPDVEMVCPVPTHLTPGTHYHLKLVQGTYLARGPELHSHWCSLVMCRWSAGQQGAVDCAVGATLPDAAIACQSLPAIALRHWGRWGFVDVYGKNHVNAKVVFQLTVLSCWFSGRLQMRWVFVTVKKWHVLKSRRVFEKWDSLVPKLKHRSPKMRDTPGGWAARISMSRVAFLADAPLENEYRLIVTR